MACAQRMFRLAHFSDVHLGPLPKPRGEDLLSKRVTGYIHWHNSRKNGGAPAILDRLIADMREHNPDHIAVTGDLTNIALPEEIENARKWLTSLGPVEKVSVIPGNHDAYVPGIHKLYGRSWAPWMTGDRGAPVTDDDMAQFPYIRRRGPLAVIGVSSAVATAPFMATGKIGGEQADRLYRALRETAQEGIFRTVMIHHPPADDPIKRAARRLVDARRFQEVIADVGAELILHGHDHMRSHTTISGPHGPVPVVGVPAGAGFHGPDGLMGGRRAAGYALHDIEPDADGYSLTVRHRALLPDGAIGETEKRQIAVGRPAAAAVT